MQWSTGKVTVYKYNSAEDCKGDPDSLFFQKVYYSEVVSSRNNAISHDQPIKNPSVHASNTCEVFM